MYVIIFVTVHAKTYRKSAKKYFRDNSGFCIANLYSRFPAKFVWIARSVAEIPIFIPVSRTYRFYETAIFTGEVR